MKKAKAFAILFLLAVYTLFAVALGRYTGSWALSGTDYCIQKTGEDAENTYFECMLLNSGMMCTGYMVDYEENTMFVRVKGQLILVNQRMVRGGFKIAVPKDYMVDNVVFVGNRRSDVNAAYKVKRKTSAGSSGKNNAAVGASAESAETESEVME